MSRSSRKKDKYGNRSGFFGDDHNEGSAARTRPFSFDEILLRRKNKKQSVDDEDVAGGAEKISEKNVSQKASDRVESERYRNNDSEDVVKVRSRKREDHSLTKESKLEKAKGKGHEYESKSRSAVDKSKFGDNSKEGKIDGRVHGKRKNDEWRSDDFEKEPEKRHSRDFLTKDKYADRSKGKSEKETIRKSRYEDDERSRDRKWHDSEFSERKEKKESSQFRHEDPRQKRRRSRSRDHHDKAKGRRSISLSPRAHKRTSYDVREHGELPSHSSKDRRLNLDVERKKISGNGSNTQNRRQDGSASRLGGYSPRKRRTEAAIKTPSPTNRSPEKKGAAWDLPPAGKESNFNKSVLSNLESSTNTPKPVVGVVSSAPSPKTNASVDSIQLTQATRPMRRLYVENLPDSASEEALMDCLNNVLVSSGVNLIQGTKPCISCIINKEKGQALAEFLTPEDATNALSFNGRSFSGSVLKIRRPKDFVEVSVRMFDPTLINIHSKCGGLIPFRLTAFRNAAEFLVSLGFSRSECFQTVAIFMQTGDDPEKSVAAAERVSNIVPDSHHKIFIGGVSKLISSEMLMEIASAFGRLKAYRFEVNDDHNEQCAFLEYVDELVTPKACAGLNGMKLGGQVLTVVQASPDASPSMENNGKSPYYGIPEHAKSLLEKPTQVIKLKNVLDPSSLSSLSEPELEEILEDVRLECARFGTVKSVNVVKHGNSSTSLEACEVTDTVGSAIDGHNLNPDDKNKSTEIIEESTINDNPGRLGDSETFNSAKELEEVKTAVETNISFNDKLDIKSEPFNSAKELEEVKTAVETNVSFNDKLDIKSEPPTTPREPVVGESILDDESTDNLVKDEQTPVDSVEDPAFQEKSVAISGEPNAPTDQSENHNQNVADTTQTGDLETENEPLVKEELKLEDNNGNSKEDLKEESGFSIEGGNKEWVTNQEDVFEVGCVLVEYRRAEASYMAAHCLHGRIFDGRIVTAEYIAHDLYKLRFPK
ncbi:hypothetical protein LguiA_001410 [Lonicera macranthoides]